MLERKENENENENEREPWDGLGGVWGSGFFPRTASVFGNQWSKPPGPRKPCLSPPTPFFLSPLPLSSNLFFLTSPTYHLTLFQFLYQFICHHFPIEFLSYKKKWKKLSSFRDFFLPITNFSIIL